MLEHSSAEHNLRPWVMWFPLLSSVLWISLVQFLPQEGVVCAVGCFCSQSAHVGGLCGLQVAHGPEFGVRVELYTTDVLFEVSCLDHHRCHQTFLSVIVVLSHQQGKLSGYHGSCEAPHGGLAPLVVETRADVCAHGSLRSPPGHCWLVECGEEPPRSPAETEDGEGGGHIAAQVRSSLWAPWANFAPCTSNRLWIAI